MLYIEQVPATRNHPGRVEREGDHTVSDVTVYGYAQAIKTFCGWLVVEELLDRDPSLRLAKPKVTKAEQNKSQAMPGSVGIVSVLVSPQGLEP
jgi:hypothetical protein